MNELIGKLIWRIERWQKGKVIKKAMEDPPILPEEFLAPNPFLNEFLESHDEPEEELPVIEMKKMMAEDFMDEGYLSEINRLFLHPLGLAMFVDPENNVYGVFDSRDDPEGYIFAEEMMPRVKAHAEALEVERNKRFKVRLDELGYIIQPVE